MADTNLAELRKQCMTSLYLCSDNIIKYLDEEKEAEFKKLSSYVEEYCTLEAREDVAKQALEKAKAETDASNVDTLDEKYNKHVNTLVKKRLKVANHPYMQDMKKRIEWGMKENRNNMDESDIAITQSDNRLSSSNSQDDSNEPKLDGFASVTYRVPMATFRLHHQISAMIDPISKKPIEDPVRNTLCSHVYERASIMELIRVNYRTKCPVVGCGNKQPVEPHHLVTDEELRFRLTMNAHSTMINGGDTLNLDESL